MNNAEAVNWLINITADIGKIEHQELWHYEQALSEIREMLENAPTIEPERKNGKWLPDNNSLYEMRFVCSECHESEVVPTIGFTKYTPIWDFCPNCGADMTEGEG